MNLGFRRKFLSPSTYVFLLLFIRTFRRPLLASTVLPTAARELGNLLFCHFECGGANVLVHCLPMRIEAIWGWRRKFCVSDRVWRLASKTGFIPDSFATAEGALFLV